jgi:hypothetical protein
MAASLLQWKSASASGNNAVTAVYDNVPSANNLLVAATGFQANTSATISNWTSLTDAKTGGSTARAIRLHYKIAAGTESSVTTNSANTDKVIIIAEYSGLEANASALIAEIAETTASSSVHSTSSVVGASELVLFATMARDGSSWSNLLVNSSTTGVTSVTTGVSGTAISLQMGQKLTGLATNRARANSSGTVTGGAGIATFKIKSVVPTVLSSIISSITTTTAIGGGNISSDGGSSILQRGFAWNTSPNPTTNNNFANTVGNIGAYQSSITGLSQSTSYYAAAFAFNAIGSAYGADIEFSTDTPSTTIPTVTTQAADPIENTYATGNGDVTNDGGDPITNRGIVWKTSAGATIDDNFSSVGGTTGAYSATIPNLTQDTQYYVNSYAINGVGSAYGTETNFTTRDYFMIINSVI